MDFLSFLSSLFTYSPPDQLWVFDETVSSISPYLLPKPPIDKRLMIVSEDEDGGDGIYHWDRPLP